GGVQAAPDAEGRRGRLCERHHPRWPDGDRRAGGNRLERLADRERPAGHDGSLGEAETARSGRAIGERPADVRHLSLERVSGWWSVRGVEPAKEGEAANPMWRSWRTRPRDIRHTYPKRALAAAPTGPPLHEPPGPRHVTFRIGRPAPRRLPLPDGPRR